MWPFKKKEELRIFSIWYFVYGLSKNRYHTYIEARNIAHAIEKLRKTEPFPISIESFEVVE